MDSKFIVNFGKYKNENIEDILKNDPIYCQWLYSQDKKIIPEIKAYIYDNLKNYTMNFGKFKGKELSLIESYYLDWLKKRIPDDKLLIKHIDLVLYSN